MSRRHRYRYESFWPAYVPVAERRAKAERAIEKLRKKGDAILPVTIEGRTIARTFWGKGWCDHLETFGDYSNRLPRGRTYVRNGAVCHLGIGRGRVEARVAGSNLYRVNVTVAKLSPKKWKALKSRCTGRIGSLIELLQGKLSDEIMDAVTDRETGLFPLPGEIQYTCSCPDWADMCKHVSAVMYGIGARLDEQPELLFLLRGVDHNDLVAGDAAAAATLATGTARRSRRRAMAAGDLSAVFGVELEPETPAAPAPEPASDAAPPPPKPTKRARPARASKPPKPAKRARPSPTSEPSKPSRAKRAASKQARPAPEPEPFEATGAAVARLRKRLDLSIAAFARALGVSPATVTNWERRSGPIRPHARCLAGLRRLQGSAGNGAGDPSKAHGLHRSLPGTHDQR